MYGPHGRRILALSATLLATVVALPGAVAGTSSAAAADRAAGRTVSGHKQHCQRPVEQESDSSAKEELTSGGLVRSYILRLPAGYDRRDDWPLIIAFHGRGSTGTEVEGFSGLSRLPAVVAYPNGATGTGSGYRQAWQGAPYEPPGVDDVAFTTQLLDHLQSTLCVDPDRTYATGKSNGAGLVGLLACRLPDRLAAVAPVSGAFYPGSQEGCEHASPVPVLDIHGTGDTTIPYGGDPDRDLPAIPDWVHGWVTRDGCRTTPDVEKTGRDITTSTWRGCLDGSEVQHVAVTDGGHVWPGADVYSGGGHVTHTIEANQVIWTFFRRHSMEQGAHR